MLFARDGTDAKNCARDIRSFMAMITCTLSISVQLTPALNNKHDDDANGASCISSMAACHTWNFIVSKISEIFGNIKFSLGLPIQNSSFSSIYSLKSFSFIYSLERLTHSNQNYEMSQLIMSISDLALHRNMQYVQQRNLRGFIRNVAIQNGRFHIQRFYMHCLQMQSDKLHQQLSIQLECNLIKDAR